MTYELDGTKIALPEHAERLRADAWAETPKPTGLWHYLLADVYAYDYAGDLISRVCKESGVNFLYYAEDGSITVSLSQDLPADQRGTLLLNLEETLKHEVDPAVTVWLEPTADKNALRKLRGIEVVHE